jgi:hypothetical protein
VSASSAELLADRGEAAAGAEFFRCPEFLAAEGVTHTLRIEAAEGILLLPLVVRPIDGGPELDAASPYGYPGAAGVPAAPIAPGSVDFSATGLVTVFVRHALGEPPLAGARERNLVQIADPSLPRKSRPSDRNQINRNRRAGYEVEIVAGPSSSGEARAAFHAAYEQTMRRAGAGERYFYGPSYFEGVLAAEPTWLALAHAPGGGVAAGSIAVRSDGYLHYYLSGTADRHLRDSPMKNLVAALVDLAVELGLPLNLGGGISPGDRLEEFKRGFANREERWRTSEIVCDPAAYHRLAAGAEGAGAVLPAQRARG